MRNGIAIFLLDLARLAFVIEDGTRKCTNDSEEDHPIPRRESLSKPRQSYLQSDEALSRQDVDSVPMARKAGLPSAGLDSAIDSTDVGRERHENDSAGKKKAVIRRRAQQRCLRCGRQTREDGCRFSLSITLNLKYLLPN